MAEKHAGGRPRKFQSVAEMDEAIQSYFDDPKSLPYTITGLALFLGMTRKGLIGYEDRDEFGNTIQRAKEFVEHCTAQRMLAGEGWGPGHIFVLKNNYGWKDTHDINQKTNMTFNFDPARKPEDANTD